jgi:RNA polymerase sigma factor (sigma-70 family)
LSAIPEPFCAFPQTASKIIAIKRRDPHKQLIHSQIRGLNIRFAQEIRNLSTFAIKLKIIRKSLKEIESSQRIDGMEEVACRDETATAAGIRGIPTRRSLLSRLKNWKDDESWRVFFDTYWRLIYNTALRAGLNDAESQDVVQETVISVLKSMPNFQYDPSKGSFKGWLLRLTKRRIVDQRRMQQRGLRGLQHRSLTGQADDKTDLLEYILDPAGGALEAIWDAEWERNLLAAALDRVKTKVDLKQYQIFDLYVVKGWKVSEIARLMRVNPGHVYLIKHRIQKLLKEEFDRICAKVA